MPSPSLSSLHGSVWNLTSSALLMPSASASPSAGVGVLPAAHSVVADESPPAPDFGTPDGYRFYLDQTSLAGFSAKHMGDRNPFWTEMFAHPNYDAFWKARNPLQYLTKVQPAVMTVGSRTVDRVVPPRGPSVLATRTNTSRSLSG